MRRRESLGVLAALAAATAMPAHSQGRTRTVGYLSNGAEVSWLSRLLGELGYVEGRNLRIEFRVSSPDRLRVEEIAAQLVATRPEVLVSFGALNVSSLAAATKTIPIVCGGTADPVGVGYAKSLRRPGGNITGLSYGVPEFAEIVIGLVRAVKPGANRLAAIIARGAREDVIAGWSRVMRAQVEAAQAAGIAWDFTPVAELKELEAALDRLDARTSVVYFVSLPEAIGDRGAASAAANRRRVATLSGGAPEARAGALMHYAIDHADPQRRVARIVDRLLRGANVAEMPFELPDRTTFIVNRATAKAVGVDLPAEVLARATEIIG